MGISKEKYIGISLMKIIIICATFIIIAFGIQYFAVSNKIYLYKLTERIGLINKFWDKDEVSNYSFYIFSAQVAITAFTSTTISFITPKVENKILGVRVSEVIVYRFTGIKMNCLELAVCNIILTLVMPVIIVIKYCEITLLIIFMVSVVFAIEILKYIIKIFFCTNYLQNQCEKMLVCEIDKIILEDVKKNYSKLSLVIKRITKSLLSDISNRDYSDLSKVIEVLCNLIKKSKFMDSRDYLCYMIIPDELEFISERLYEIKLLDGLKSLAINGYLLEMCNYDIYAKNKLNYCESFNSVCIEIQKKYFNLLVNNKEIKNYDINSIEYFLHVIKRVIFIISPKKDTNFNSNLWVEAYKEMINKLYENRLINRNIVEESFSGLRTALLEQNKSTKIIDGLLNKDI